MIPRWPLAAIGIIVCVLACERSPSRPIVNDPPNVRITEGASDSADVDYRVTFRWLGWDDDGAVDHFLYALDQGSRIARSGAGDDALVWQRIDGHVGTFRFDAMTPDPSDPYSASDWSRFLIRAVDDDGALSDTDERYFNARTIAPDVGFYGRLATGSTDYEPHLCIPVHLSWHGVDLDAVSPARLPIGYQMRLVPLAEGQDPIAAVLTDSEYEWFPSLNEPYREQETTLDFADLPSGRYSFAVRALDDAGALTPAESFSLFTGQPGGNVVVLDSRDAIPFDFTHFNLYAWTTPIFDGTLPQTEPIEIRLPQGIKAPLKWELLVVCSSSVESFDYFYALDIPDPSCTTCTDPDGVGGWAQAMNTVRVGSSVPGSHAVYLRAENDAVTHLLKIDLVVGDRSNAGVVDDFSLSGIADCPHDAIVGAWVSAAEVATGLPFEHFSTRGSPVSDPCAEGALLGVLGANYYGIFGRSLLLWNVAGATTSLGRVTNPSPSAHYGRYLGEYVDDGGSVVIWGANSIGAMLGDFAPNNTAYIPAGGGPTPSFEEGSFVWDYAGLRTTFDRVRGVDPENQLACSGIVGLEATPKAIQEGYPAGVPDPTGSLPNRTALWIDTWTGFENASGWKGAVAMTGDPPLHMAGLDTLYTIVTNSVAWQHAGTNGPCGDAGGSPIDGGGIITRYRDPAGTSGAVVWIGTPLYMFNEHHAQDVALIISKLAAWAAEP